jgi:conjugal transfer mating pair stabilization protein TraN
MKRAITLLSIFTLNNISFAMDCSNLSSFKEYNGHYYTASLERLTFNEAKTIAKNNGGYLTIPNSSGENKFIKGLVGGNYSAWIGIEDTTLNSNYGTISTSRFKDVKGNSLSYSNWASGQPDNFVGDYDIQDEEAMVSPLGEHWVIIDGNSGKMGRCW